MSADPNQLLDIICDALLELDTEDGVPAYRPREAELVGRYSGVSEDEGPRTIDGEQEPLVLILTMRDGNKYRLSLDVVEEAGE
jgi:hypothetical protein